jgi:hypothetical protein
MTTRDDLARAADEARAQVQEARDALSASRDARSGGVAKNARQAEQQLHALRGAVADDVRALRDRIVGLDPSARRGVGVTAAVGAGTLTTLLGAGLALRRRVRRGIETRGIEREAVAIAAAMARQALDPTASAPRTVAPRRGRRATLIAVLVAGAALAGGVVLQQRRTAPVDPDDLWLPEDTPGPA